MKIRPQIMAAIVVLAGLGGYALSLDAKEIAGVCAAGIIALGKDLLQGD